MALAHADRVKETSTTTGTGSYSLAGAATGFQTFVAGVGDGNTCYYMATDSTDWEVGIGTVTDGSPDTLARTTILASSNGGSAVSWSAGTKTIVNTIPAGKFLGKDELRSGQTLHTFGPLQNEPPASNYATLNVRNGHPVLEFDDTTSWAAVFTGILPRSYAGGGLTVYIHAAAVATTGTMGWLVAIERIDDSSLDIDADSFASDVTVTAATVPGTSGQTLVLNAAFTSGAAMDSLAAGEQFRLKIARDVSNDTAVGNVQIVSVEIKET